jgi:nicotinamidase-related amidase
MSNIQIVVDVQNDFCSEDANGNRGSLGIPGADKAYVATLSKYLSEVSDEDHLIFTRDWHPPNHVSFAPNPEMVFQNQEIDGRMQTLWPVHCVQDTWGARICLDSSLKPDLILDKGTNERYESYGAFVSEPTNEERIETPLGDMLAARVFKVVSSGNPIGDIIITGLAYDYCVKHTALQATQFIKSLGGMFRGEVVVLKDLTRSVAPDNDEDTTKELEEAGVKVRNSQ